MLEIGVTEAQSRLPEILKRVAESGETVNVISYGKTIAVISAPRNTSPGKKQDAWGRLLQLRNMLGLTPEEVAESKSEGRP